VGQPRTGRVGGTGLRSGVGERRASKELAEPGGSVLGWERECASRSTRAGLRVGWSSGGEEEMETGARDTACAADLMGGGRRRASVNRALTKFRWRRQFHAATRAGQVCRSQGPPLQPQPDDQVERSHEAARNETVEGQAGARMADGGWRMAAAQCGRRAWSRRAVVLTRSSRSGKIRALAAPGWRCLRFRRAHALLSLLRSCTTTPALAGESSTKLTSRA
jgi:hypothetical protein